MKHYYLLDRADLPQSWDDLSSKQLATTCELLEAQLPIYARIERLLGVLFNIQEGYLHTSLDEAVEAVGFLLEPTTRTLPPFSKYRLGMSSLYPPSTRLGNSTFGEFITADAAFMKYAKTGDEAHLNKLCACLYRPSKWVWERRSRNYNGDRRIPFNSNTVNRQAKKWAKAPLADRLAILSFFAGSRTAIAKAHPRLFKSDGGGKGSSWLGALHAFTDNLTQYDAVLDSRNSLVLNDFSKQLEDAERIEELINNRKL